MNPPQTDDICRRMDEVRGQLGHEMDEIVDSARTLTDWRFYMRKYPWWCIAGAAAVGYCLVPKRLQIVSPSAEALEKLAKRHKLVVKSDAKQDSRSGLTGALLSLLATAAVRGAMGSLGNNAGSLFGDGTAVRNRSAAGSRAFTEDDKAGTENKPATTGATHAESNRERADGRRASP